MSRLRSTALPALAFAVSAGLLMPTAPALADTPSAASTAASTAAMAAPQAAKPKAKPYPKPRNVVYGDDGSLHLAWDHIRGVGCYMIQISKRGYDGPWRPWFTTHDGITFKKSVLPYKSSKMDQPYDFWIWAQTSCGVAPKRRSAVAKVNAFISLPPRAAKIPVNAPKETPKQKKQWMALVNDCGDKGGDVFLETGVTTAASALIASWIPGVGEVTIAAVIGAATAAGTLAMASCLYDNATGNSALHRSPTLVRPQMKARAV